MRKDLGVPLYVAAGYCDLGSGYLNLTVITKQLMLRKEIFH